METAVIVTHLPTGVSAEANERRQQAENLEVAIFRLRLKLALEVRSNRSDIPATPSPLWLSRCHNGKIAVKPTHHGFPTLLAEALDVLFTNEDDPKQAAEALEVSTSQLLKFLKQEPRAFAGLNQRRQQAGLHPLK